MTPTATTREARRPATRTARAQAPRRVSGPARSPATAPRPRPRPTPAPSRARRPQLTDRLLAFVRALPDHALLDRLVRGRAWIPVLGVMLVGIVAMQVEDLKLGASIGRSIERGSALQSRNELLRASVASLSDDQRIERLAAGMGMVMPGPTTLSFLSTHAADARHAAANIHAPDASTFLASLARLNASASASQPATTQQAASSTTSTATTLSSTSTSATSSQLATTATQPSTTTPVQAAATTQSTSTTTQTTSGGATPTGG